MKSDLFKSQQFVSVAFTATMAEHSGVGSLQETETDMLSHACDLFRPVTKEISLIEGKEIAIRASNLQSSDGPFTFLIPKQSEYYIQLASAELWGECKIVVANDDGSFRNIAATDNVSVVNLFAASLFKDIRVEVNNVQLADLSCAHANIKNYIETILTYGSDALNSHLKTQLFLLDTPGQFEAFGAEGRFDDPEVIAETGEYAPTNWGYHGRKDMIKESRLLDFQLPLSHNFVQADRLILRNCEVKIELIRAPDAYSILSPDANKKFVVQIKDLQLFVRIVKVAKRVADYHKTMLTKEPVMYPINRTVIKSYNASRGDTNVDLGQIFQGKCLPKHVIIGMLTTAAYNGSYKTNPLFFQTFNVVQTHLNVNNVSVLLKPYTPDFPSGRFCREFKSLFKATGIANENAGTLVTKELFASGLYLQAYDLSPCQCNGMFKYKHMFKFCELYGKVVICMFFRLAHSSTC
jgi:hypothetical protein